MGGGGGELVVGVMVDGKVDRKSGVYKVEVGRV